MSLAAVVVPAAPALLPGIGGRADPLAELRGRARRLVAETVAETRREAPRLVIVGAGRSTQTWPVDAPSGAARFTSGRVPEGGLPTALEIGRQLAPSGGGTSVLQSIAADASPAECVALGRTLTDAPADLLLVVADGPATLTAKAPGHLHPDATTLAEGLARALAEADTAGLTTLDPAVCEQVWMRGRPALQVLAGAFAGPARVRGEVLASEAPFGVQYLLARWR